LIYEVIFEADTRAGKAFDVLLLVGISLSVVVVALESISSFAQDYGAVLYALEWFFTVLFTVEYALRLYSVRKPHLYALSFFGIVDLFSILPTYLSLAFAGAQTLLIIRVLRLLRVFRVFKLSRYIGEAHVLMDALALSKHKITVFFGAVLTIVLIMGSLMYLVEGSANGFTSIPRGIYWAIVTLTTVGYGDMAPQTSLGQAISSFVMLLGYSIIAVPTGILTVSLTEAHKKQDGSLICDACRTGGHQKDALYCRVCGDNLKR